MCWKSFLYRSEASLLQSLHQKASEDPLIAVMLLQALAVAGALLAVMLLQALAVADTFMAIMLLQALAVADAQWLSCCCRHWQWQGSCSY